MNFLSALDISGSGLTAQKLRMDVISQNIANAEVSKTSAGTPYRRKMVVLGSIKEGESFRTALDKASGGQGRGVEVKKIVEDPAAFTPVYNPGHPDANEEGYVMMPNVNKTQEMVDMLSTSRAYEANVTVFNATKAMVLKALEIGR